MRGPGPFALPSPWHPLFVAHLVLIIGFTFPANEIATPLQVAGTGAGLTLSSLLPEHEEKTIADPMNKVITNFFMEMFCGVIA